MRVIGRKRREQVLERLGFFGRARSKREVREDPSLHFRQAGLK